MAGVTQQLQDGAELHGWDNEAEERDYGMSPPGKALQHPIRIRSVSFRQLEGSGREVGVETPPLTPLEPSAPLHTLFNHLARRRWLAESPQLLQEINRPQ